jgi:hypothetical protein
MDNRVLELAIEALEQRKAAIDQEIRRLRGTSWQRMKSSNTGTPKSGRRRTAAQKKAQSVAMKAYWARKRGESRRSMSGGRRRAQAPSA